MSPRPWRDSPIAAALPFVLLLAAGCGSMAASEDQEIGILCVPGASVVTVDGREAGRTPADSRSKLVLRLKRDQSHVVVLEKDGYLPQSTTIQSVGFGASSEYSPSYVTNQIAAPFVVKHRLQPENLYIQLVPDPDWRSRTSPAPSPSAAAVAPPGTQPPAAAPDSERLAADRAAAKSALVRRLKLQEIDQATFDTEMRKLYPEEYR